MGRALSRSSVSSTIGRRAKVVGSGGRVSGPDRDIDSVRGVSGRGRAFPGDATDRGIFIDCEEVYYLYSKELTYTHNDLRRP